MTDLIVPRRALVGLVTVVGFALTSPLAAQTKQPPRSDAPGSEIIECLGLRDGVEGKDETDPQRRIEACSALLDTPGVGDEVRARAFAMRALAYSLRLDYDQAIRDYDEAIKLRPDFAVALNNRAWAYFKSGRPAQGLPDVEQSLRHDGLSAHSYDTRAHIYKALGQPQQAMSDYRRALRLADKKLIMLYQCGLHNEGHYLGKQDGVLSDELYDAMEKCVAATSCDPLPPDEECRIGTSRLDVPGQSPSRRYAGMSYPRSRVGTRATQ